MDAAPLKTYRDIIDLWKSKAALARFLDIGVRPEDTGKFDGLIRNWYARDAIPEVHFERLVWAANHCGFDGVTYVALTRMVRGAALQQENEIGSEHRRDEAARAPETGSGPSVGSGGLEEGQCDV